MASTSSRTRTAARASSYRCALSTASATRWPSSCATREIVLAVAAGERHERDGADGAVARLQRHHQARAPRRLRPGVRRREEERALRYATRATPASRRRRRTRGSGRAPPRPSRARARPRCGARAWSPRRDRRCSSRRAAAAPAAPPSPSSASVDSGCSSSSEVARKRNASRRCAASASDCASKRSLTSRTMLVT